MVSDISFGYADGGHSCCIIKYKGLEFVGEATCHPDDMDFESERTGLCIAEARANIKVLKFKRKFEIIPALQSLRHLYGNMRSSKKYNPKSYEAQMIRSQLRALEKELDTISNDIVEEEKYLNEYIQKKDAFYQRLRAKNQ